MVQIEEGWTPGRVEILTKLWAEEGLSAGKIAKRLGAGISRNAVLSKVNQLDLEQGPAVKEPPPKKVEPVPDEELPESVESWMCRWPEMGKRGLPICGKTAQPGRHFCDRHLTMAYLQTKK